jgi:hypothetical protein
MKPATLRALGVLWLALACRGADGNPDPVTGVVARDCFLNGPTVSPAVATLHVGDTLPVSVKPAPAECWPSQTPQSYRWLSSDTAIARIDSVTGVARARKAGIATITASEVSQPSVRAAMVLQVAP